ncbi:MAG: hypothetical protein Q8P02_00195 [Candidatus Micrarchaeota archaeon]|nr:hypothetical protein [Candidatus Micrarchaeota archaeon]
MEPVTLITYAAGGVGVVGAALFIYVYRTFNRVERQFSGMRARTERVVHDFSHLSSSVSALSGQAAAKASYQDTEAALKKATRNVVLRGTSDALSEENPSIRVGVN